MSGPRKEATVLSSAMTGPAATENTCADCPPYGRPLSWSLSRRVERRFVNKDWNQLPQDLERGDLDVVLNGYEWMPERTEKMASSVPYYAYRLRLIVRNDSPITDWRDLKPGMKVGVLKDSAAHRY